MQITRLDRLARLGYFARATVYALLGYLALTTRHLAFRGPTGEFELLRRVPGGRIILFALAFGLLAYGLYKLLGALLDIDSKGSSPKGIIKRLAFGGGGAAYLVLSWIALQFGTDTISTGGQSGKKQAAAAILQLPLGSLALALAGGGFFLAAAIQLRSAIGRRFMRKLQSDAPPLSCTIGRVGLSARAIVFAIIGWSILQGAWRSDENQVRDLGGALALLHGYQALYLAVAVGLLVFAAYSAIEARYRIVPPIDPVDAGKQIAMQLQPVE
jgi:hypothetical protein